MSLGGTRTILSPALRRSASKRRDRCLQSSTAQHRCVPKRSAQRTISRWSSDVVAKVVFAPNCRPTSSTATTVCVRLWASIPKVIIQSPFSIGDENGTGRWAHLSGGDATLLSSHAGRFRASGSRQKACCPRGTPSVRAKLPDEYQPDTDTSVPILRRRQQLVGPFRSRVNGSSCARSPTVDLYSTTTTGVALP
jgi:hypothetical protein